MGGEFASVYVVVVYAFECWWRFIGFYVLLSGSMGFAFIFLYFF